MFAGAVHWQHVSNTVLIVPYLGGIRSKCALLVHLDSAGITSTSDDIQQRGKVCLVVDSMVSSVW